MGWFADVQGVAASTEFTTITPALRGDKAGTSNAIPVYWAHGCPIFWNARKSGVCLAGLVLAQRADGVRRGAVS
jgi:hypothetical protein